VEESGAVRFRGVREEKRERERNVGKKGQGSRYSLNSGDACQ